MSILYPGHLPPTPRDPSGAALRVEASESSPPSTLGPLTGPTRQVDGVTMVEVTFRASAPPSSRILLHLNGFTDDHRHTLTPSLLRPTPDANIHQATLLLPADGVFSYRFVDVTDLPDDIGTTRPGWRRIHERGHADPANPERFRGPFGAENSIWRGPTSGAPLWPTRDVEGWQEISHEGGARRIHILPGDDLILVLFDGQFWQHLAPGAGLRALGHKHTIVLIPTEMDQRAAEMTTAPAAIALLRTALEAASQCLGRSIPAAYAVAGQSFSALAVAHILADAPHLLEAGIVQSASLWYPHKGGDTPGDLLRLLEDGQGHAEARTIIQVGAHEPFMLPYSRRYYEILRSRGADVTYHEARGGHDYAWWRLGLAKALADLANTSM
ncbi:MAG: DUF3327 domain-containing protein [Actinomycetaceae bacterium]|nr:DUF3327 domain-containing protein [Actinomycetaceae bacterium]